VKSWYLILGQDKHSPLPRSTFHLVTASPWPLGVALTAAPLALGLAMYMNAYKGGGLLLLASITILK